MGTAGKVLAVVLGAAALVGGGVAIAFASGKGGGGAPAVSVTGQDYFNKQSAAQQEAIINALYVWYQDNKSTGWPSDVQDPGLSTAADLVNDASGGNFFLTVDAYQQAFNNEHPDAPAEGAAGVLDAKLTASLLATR